MSNIFFSLSLYSIEACVQNKHQAHLDRSFFKESGVLCPEVIGVDVFRLGVLSCQHAAPNGAVAHNPYTKLLAHWDQIFLQAIAYTDC